MKYTLHLLFACLFIVLSYNAAHAQTYLFNNGRTDYTIVLATDASTTEAYAARELQTYISRISRANINVVNAGSIDPTIKTQGSHIYIGWTKDCGSPRYNADDEGFTYKTIGTDLYIYGGRDRGTMYGVFTFMEQELGIHWYADTYTYIPSIRKYHIGRLNHSERPVIPRRLDLYYFVLAHNDWAVHNRLNSHWSYTKGDFGELNAYYGGHSFSRFIPADKYYATHPEYFSEYKGERIQNGQLCLSNKSMRKQLIRNLKDIIRNNPGYWCYDVSQNDNMKPCECADCKALVEKYGGQSGAMIWFVNKVADEVRKTYPDVMIGTFAYQYTRQAPTSSIKPKDNVVVRLCDIECCMAHPLTQCPRNASFIKDLNDWGKIAKHLFLWDYTTGFYGYLLPFPNFKSLAENYRLFARSNVIGILEEGQHESEWGEFSELKGWLIAKLMWNPDINVDSLARMFIKDYYAEAATYIQQYYDLCNEMITDDRHFTIKIDEKADIYDDEFVRKSSELLNAALSHAKGNAEVLKRTKRIAAQIYFLRMKKNLAGAKLDGSLGQLQEILNADKTYVREPAYSLDKMLKEMEYR